VLLTVDIGRIDEAVQAGGRNRSIGGDRKIVPAQYRILTVTGPASPCAHA
jgi:hypothetical protein